MKKDLGLNLTVSFVLGAVIWALSPTFTGHLEPWDSQTIYYPVSLFLSGLLSGILLPKQFWIHYPGIIVGQLVYMICFLPSGPMFFVGVILLAACSLIALVGAVVGAGIRRLLAKRVGNIA